MALRVGDEMLEAFVGEHLVRAYHLEGAVKKLEWARLTLQVLAQDVLHVQVARRLQTLPAWRILAPDLHRAFVLRRPEASNRSCRRLASAAAAAAMAETLEKPQAVSETQKETQAASAGLSQTQAATAGFSETETAAPELATANLQVEPVTPCSVHGSLATDVDQEVAEQKRCCTCLRKIDEYNGVVVCRAVTKAPAATWRCKACHALKAAIARLHKKHGNLCDIAPPSRGGGSGGGVEENKKQSIVVAGLFSYWGGRLWYAWVLAGQHMLVWGARSCTLSLSLSRLLRKPSLCTQLCCCTAA